MNKSNHFCTLALTLALPLGIFWLASCVNPEISPRRTDLAEASSSLAATSPPAQIKLIDRTLVEQYPHLRRHQGQFVLGMDHIQLIPSGVPPLAQTPHVYPLLSHIYKPTGKVWQRQSWLPQLEMSVQSAQGDFLQLVGQDSLHEDGRASVISVFKSKLAGGGRVKLELSLLADGSGIKVSLLNQGVPAPLKWQFKMSSELGEEHFLSLDQNQSLGFTVSLLPDSLSLLADAPLVISHSNNMTAAQGFTPGPQGRSSFLILLGRTGALAQIAWVDQIKRCWQKRQSLASPNLDCFQVEANDTKLWQVQLPARTSSSRAERRFMQPLYIHDKQGYFLSLFGIFEGEQLKIRFPESGAWELLYPDSAGILQTLAFDSTTRSAALPELPRGQVQIDLAPATPSIVDIRNAVHHEGVGFASLIAARPNDQLSAHNFLQRTWPMQMSLPAGDFNLQIFNGTTRLCSQRFTVLPGKAQTIRCQNEPSKNRLSARVNLSLDDTQKFKDLALAAEFKAVSRLNRTNSGTLPGLIEIPMLLAEDLSLGLNLRAFPVNDSIRNAWQKISAGLRDEAPLPIFVRFAREQKPSLQLVLECPMPGFQTDDYRWLALTLTPDILEVFGCQQPSLALDLLHVAEQLQQKSRYPIKLAAASPYRTALSHQGLIPALFVPNWQESSDPQSLDTLTTALLQGRYSLGYRSEIQVELPLLKIEESGIQILKLRLVSYDLKNKPGILRIYDQNGLLAEQLTGAFNEAEQNLTLQIKLRQGSKFIRVELLDQDPSELTATREKKPAFLVAASNFLSLNGRL